MIPVPFVLQLAFQPRERLGGSEPLFDSDHAELLHPGVTNRDCCDHPGVTPVCGGSFVPSLGLEPPPSLLESSSQQQLRAELGIESPQSRSPPSPGRASRQDPANQSGIDPLGRDPAKDRQTRDKPKPPCSLQEPEEEEGEGPFPTCFFLESRMHSFIPLPRPHLPLDPFVFLLSLQINQYCLSLRHSVVLDFIV